MKKYILLLSLITMTIANLSMKSQCDGPTDITTIETPTVSTSVTTGQVMWTTPGATHANHEFPIGSGRHVFFSGSMWVGGLDSNNSLHLAAMKYGVNGDDFFPGPLAEFTAETGPEICSQYDQFYTVTRAESYLHYLYFQAIDNGIVDELFPDGYDIPSSFDTYPAHGNEAVGQSHYLAPFYDYDGDGYYDPSQGDFPYFDGLGGGSGCTPCNSLGGDVATFWINNDTGGFHTESGGSPLGIEIHNQTFTFNNVEGTPAENSTFYHKKIINRGTGSYHDVYISFFADVDIGGPSDDFVGCNLERNLAYGYNGDNMDETTSGVIGYGTTPPTAGIVILKGPLANATGMDEDGDAIVDNETLGMTNFITTQISDNEMGDPILPMEYYNIMQSKWKNGSPLTYGAGQTHTFDIRLINIK